ncbi:hypothetical protein CEP52_017360 [Fusarium oligoseptatum]|uniref:Uncharacterized protein n=1 Tax=Fusarium oligoseptatum TaxID=2604345 RepID=A0A428RSS7_9HYPO|nr:hypothetical protein CEP52_017360 [Fusarium oligoseptatum]
MHLLKFKSSVLSPFMTNSTTHLTEPKPPCLAYLTVISPHATSPLIALSPTWHGCKDDMGKVQRLQDLNQARVYGS